MQRIASSASITESEVSTSGLGSSAGTVPEATESGPLSPQTPVSSGVVSYGTIRQLAEERLRAEAEQRRLDAIAAAEAAEQQRIAQIAAAEAEQRRLVEEAAAEVERQRLDAIAVAEAAEQQRLAVIAAAEAAELQRLAAIAATEAERVRLTDAATALYSAQNYAASIPAFGELIAFTPTNAWAYHMRADCHRALGADQAAIQDMTSAIQHDATNMHYYLCRGLIHRQFNREVEAVNDFNEAAGFDANRFDIFYHRGCAFVALNNLRAARGDFDTAIRLQSDHAGSQHMLAHVNAVEAAQAERIRVANEAEQRRLAAIAAAEAEERRRNSAEYNTELLRILTKHRVLHHKPLLAIYRRFQSDPYNGRKYQSEMIKHIRAATETPAAKQKRLADAAARKKSKAVTEAEKKRLAAEAARKKTEAAAAAAEAKRKANVDKTTLLGTLRKHKGKPYYEGLKGIYYPFLKDKQNGPLYIKKMRIYIHKRGMLQMLSPFYGEKSLSKKLEKLNKIYRAFDKDPNNSGIYVKKMRMLISIFSIKKKYCKEKHDKWQRCHDLRKMYKQFKKEFKKQFNKDDTTLDKYALQMAAEAKDFAVFLKEKKAKAKASGNGTYRLVGGPGTLFSGKGSKQPSQQQSPSQEPPKSCKLKGLFG